MAEFTKIEWGNLHEEEWNSRIIYGYILNEDEIVLSNELKSSDSFNAGVERIRKTIKIRSKTSQIKMYAQNHQEFTVKNDEGEGYLDMGVIIGIAIETLTFKRSGYMRIPHISELEYQREVFRKFTHDNPRFQGIELDLFVIAQ